MSLYDYINIFKSETPALAESHSIIRYLSEDQYHLLHQVDAYNIELTISPKGSPKINKLCQTCYGSTPMSTEEQIQIMEQLIVTIYKQHFIKYIMGSYELYSDGINIHAHLMINNLTSKDTKKLKKIIYEHYDLRNEIIVKPKMVRSTESYINYFTKNPVRVLCIIKDKRRQQIIDNRKQKQQKTTQEKQQKIERLKEQKMDEYTEHLLTCTRDGTKCGLCKYSKQQKHRLTVLN